MTLLDRLGPIPTTIVHLDFETFHSAEFTLSKLTTEAYVRDERFEVLGVGVRVGDAPAVWLEEWDFAAWLKRVDWSRVAINAHHAQFEGLILSERYGVRPAFWLDTMALGRVLHGAGSLEVLAEVLEIGRKGDAIKAGTVKGKRRRDLTQREWLALGDYCKNDVDLSAAALAKMRRGFPPLELWAIDTTVRMFTEPVLTADPEVLSAALADERAKKKALLTQIAQHVDPSSTDPLEAARAALASNDKFAELLTSLGVPVPMKANEAGEQKPAFAKNDPGFAALLEHPEKTIREICQARLGVKSTIVETRTERLLGIHQRGFVPFYLKYCGAHTHRWSGGDRMNPQNFNRGGALRAAIRALARWLLVVADSGQIEARMVAWVAGERSVLDAFRRNDANGGDFYSDVGSSFFGKKLSKKDTPIERQIAKVMVLGLGFGMGWAKFGAELLKGLLGADPVRFTIDDARKFGVDVLAFRSAPFGDSTCGARVAELLATGIRLSPADALVHFAVAAHLVRVYRRANAKIAAFWRACDQALEIMARDGDATATRGTVGHCRIVRHGLIKPNGLKLRYPGLRRGKDGFTYLGGESGRERVHIYGALLAENIVQSLARDVVTEQALSVRADGVRVASTTHDEILGVVPEADAPLALERMIAAMRTPPAWCADLPLNAEGATASSYGDAK